MVLTFTNDSSVEILHSEIPTLTSASGFDAHFSLQFALREIPSLTSAFGFDVHFGLLFTLRTSTLALVLDELFGLRFRFGGNFGGAYWRTGHDGDVGHSMWFSGGFVNSVQCGA